MTPTLVFASRNRGKVAELRQLLVGLELRVLALDEVDTQVPEVIEPHVLSWFFDSSRIPGPKSEGANRWRYQNKELDRLFEVGRTQVDRKQLRAAYERVQSILARDIPVLPLWQPDTVAVIRRGSSFDVPRDGRFGTLAF